MSYNETVLKDLLRIIPQKGKVEWIGIRPKKKEDLSVVESIKVTKETGLVGDHFKGNFSVKGKLQLFHKENPFPFSSI